ncbi:MAG: GHKL domain-containing protein [Deltaproteobacteria bacterium]|nr:GHKL domain-containing protein [Deltaproteobacteria bacterium]
MEATSQTKMDYIGTLEAQLEKSWKDLSRVEEDLNKSRSMFQAILQAISDIVIVFDKDLNIKIINRQVNLRDKKCHEFFFGVPGICEDCPVLRTIQEKRSITVEKVIRNEYYRIQTHPLMNLHGEVEGVIEVSRPITRDKAREQQLFHADKLSSLGLLVSGIVHEINNPNAYICGNIPLIKEAFKTIFPILDEHLRQNPDFQVARLDYSLFKENVTLMLDDMIQGCSRIQNILGSLKSFTRRAEGLLSERVDLNDVVNEGMRLVYNTMKRMAVIHTDLQEGLPGIKGNKDRLIQVFVNLMINAWQAIDKEKGNIWIKTQFDPKENCVCLSISDEGCGMGEFAKAQIFNPFFTTKKEGTGLGLSIVSKIVSEHNGRTDVESEVGKGSTFTIRLPVES